LKTLQHSTRILKTLQKVHKRILRDRSLADRKRQTVLFISILFNQLSLFPSARLSKTSLQNSKIIHSHLRKPLIDSIFSPSQLFSTFTSRNFSLNPLKLLPHLSSSIYLLRLQESFLLNNILFQPLADQRINIKMIISEDIFILWPQRVFKF
jgi:hypothetical protein